MSLVLYSRRAMPLILLFRLQLQLVLQSRHDLTRAMVIEPRGLVAAQPPGTPTALDRRIVDAQVLLDRSREQLTQLRQRQRGGPDFFPAASPDSGTTRPAAPGLGGDATRASSSPDSPPSPTRSWLA